MVWSLRMGAWSHINMSYVSQTNLETLPYPDRNPLLDALDENPVPSVDEKAEGEAVIEVSFLTRVEGRADNVDLYGRV